MIGRSFAFPFEAALIEWLQRFLSGSPWIIAVLSLITELGDAAFAVVFIGFLYFGYDKKSGSRLAIQSVASMTFNGLIKNIVLRRRPYFDHKEISCLKAVNDRYDIYDIAGQGFSFPSGHATNSGSLLTSLYLLFRNKKILAVGGILVFLVCLSRIVLGVHYPSDVLAGLLLGIAASCLIYRFMERCDKSKVYLMLLLLGLPGLCFCHSHDFFSSYGLLIGFTMGDLFENRFVNFDNTRSFVRILLRLIGAVVVFLAISEGLKLPFSVIFLEGDAFLSHLFRAFRYALACFMAIGIYPYVFRYDIFKLNDRK
jgi:undecaprenyl-diphosphatase